MRFGNVVRDAVPLLALVLAVNLCAAAGPSPSDTIAAYYDAMRRQDVTALKKTISKVSLKAMEGGPMPVDDLLKLHFTSDAVPARMPEVRNEKITGDKATLEVRDEKRNRWETVHFVREDGTWKVSLEEDEQDHAGRHG